MKEEIRKRIELVGPIPRRIFDSSLFVKDIKDHFYDVSETAEKISDSYH